MGLFMAEKTAEKIVKDEAEWKQKLTPEQYHVTREAGTECAFTGAYWNTKEPGMYHCVCCGSPLFDSQTKFNSGTGWPSFYKPAEGGGVVEHKDTQYGMVRTEVRCAKCDAHLGHVFRGWSGADRAAILHEFGGARFQAGGEEVTAQRPACSNVLLED